MKNTRLHDWLFNWNALFGLMTAVALFVVSGCNQPQEGNEPAVHSTDSAGTQDDGDDQHRNESGSGSKSNSGSGSR